MSRSQPWHDTVRPAPSGLPRLLAGISSTGPLSWQEHLALHGSIPFARRRDHRRAPALIEQVERAGLRGRGGAAFPSAAKLRAVAGARGRPVVVINAAEGEPASTKDRLLLARVPQLVLDGGVLAARAVGAHEVIVGVSATATSALRAVECARSEREVEGLQEPRIRIHPLPGGYVSGQETALVNHINGGPALPTFALPAVYERGVARRPTLVNNAETLAQLALIARHGVDWFRELGTAAQPGTTLITLSGGVADSGVYEIEHGTPLRALIDAAGGERSPIRALLVGGYAGTWLSADLAGQLELGEDSLAPHGATLGPGVVVMLSEQACPVAETVRVMRWLAAQSARQCGPCVNGLEAIARSLEGMQSGTAPESHWGV